MEKEKVLQRWNEYIEEKSIKHKSLEGLIILKSHYQKKQVRMNANCIRQSDWFT